jgi:hypothetical protein
MIAYDLKCRRGHEFEAWFKNGKTFERQKKQGLIACPSCGSSRVTMVYRPQAISRSPRRSAPPPAASVAARIEAFLSEHFEDVGRDFADEARKLHYGDEEPRGIRGETTADEDRELREEGIHYVKIALPKPSN